MHRIVNFEPVISTQEPVYRDSPSGKLEKVLVFPLQKGFNGNSQTTALSTPTLNKSRIVSFKSDWQEQISGEKKTFKKRRVKSQFLTATRLQCLLAA